MENMFWNLYLAVGKGYWQVAVAFDSQVHRLFLLRYTDVNIVSQFLDLCLGVECIINAWGRFACIYRIAFYFYSTLKPIALNALK